MEYEKKYNLSPYTYDESWYDFLNNANLEDAFTTVNSNDINKYHWNSQLVKLNEKGYGKLNNVKHLPHTKFIVTLNGKKFFAGEFIRYESAMSLRHPVIFFDIGELYKLDGYYLQILPNNIIGKRNIIKEFFESTGVEEINMIKDYFDKIGKLK